MGDRVRRMAVMLFCVFLLLGQAGPFALALRGLGAKI